MIEALINALEFFPRGLVYVGLGLVLLFLAKLANDLITRHNINEEIGAKSNTAIALGMSGYFAGVTLVFVGAIFQPLTVAVDDGLGFNREFGADIVRVLLYSLAGIVALNLSRILMDRLVLFKFSVQKELVEDQNVGTAAVEFGMQVAIGLLIAGAIAGSGGGPDTALAFFGLGLVVLILFALFYEFTTPFNIHDEIEKDNAAVGVSLGGNLIAIGLVMLKAVFGDFIGWGASIAEFLTFAIIGFVLLYVLRLLIDLVLLPRIKVSNALTAERNLGVAFIESTVVISAALILFFAI